MATMMAGRYLFVLHRQDKVAVNPHAGPLINAIHYLLGLRSGERLQRFRASGG